MRSRWLEVRPRLLPTFTSLAACALAVWAPSLVVGCGVLPEGDGELGSSDARADYSLPPPVSIDDLAACPGDAPRLDRGAEALFTLMVYGAADNDLEEKILDDVREMAAGYRAGTSSVNVVAQLDVRTEPGTKRFTIYGEEGELRVAAYESAEELNTGDPENLVAFAKWAATCFPAERYGLIVEGHGTPWSERRGTYARRARERAEELRESVRLLAYDQTSDEAGLDNPELSVADLTSALRAIDEELARPSDPRSHERFVMYGSDACLMQTAEVAYALRNTVLYVVGSADTEPDVGWPYNTIVGELTDNAQRRAADPAVLASHIVDRYQSSVRNRSGDTFRETTLAAIRPIEMNRVAGSIGRVGAGLVDLLEAEGAEAAKHIWAARRDAYTFGDSYGDLPLFLERVVVRLTEAGLMPAVHESIRGRDEAHALREAIRELIDASLLPNGGRLHDLVLRHRSGRAYPGAWGLSIYLPFTECADGKDLDDYAGTEFARETGWAGFVQTLLRYPAPADPANGEYYGKGALTIRAGDHALENVPVYCDVLGGRLDVYSEDDQMDLGLQASFEGEEIRLEKIQASVDGIELDDWVDATLQSRMDDGLLAEGSTHLMVDEVNVDVELRCGSYERKACD